MAALPQFFIDTDFKEHTDLWLDEDTAKHIVQVLRMQLGQQLQLTNGKGFTAIAAIKTAEKKKCSVSVNIVTFHELRQPALHLCIGFTKNTSRNEWLLEKATELGVRSITPLVATRTEREHIRYDRWRNILVASIMQSQQHYLPTLHEATKLDAVIDRYAHVQQKFIAHCIADRERHPLSRLLKPGRETLIFIGPEGDFTEDEVNLCMRHGFVAASMGAQRLRTETAAITACAYFNLVNHYDEV